MTSCHIQPQKQLVVKLWNYHILSDIIITINITIIIIIIITIIIIIIHILCHSYT